MPTNNENRTDGLTYWTITNLLRGEITSSFARSPPDEVIVCISDEATYPAFVKGLHRRLEKIAYRRASIELDELLPDQAVSLYSDASKYGIVPALVEEGHVELDFTPAQLAYLLHCWNCEAPNQNKPRWGFDSPAESSEAVQA